MERKAFQTWLSAIDTLSAAQKTEVGEVLAGHPVGEASLAAVESSVGEPRLVPIAARPSAPRPCEMSLRRSWTRMRCG